MLSNSIHIGRRGVALGGGGGTDADAAALIELMTVPPDATRQGHINTLVGSLKSAGVWTLLDELWIMAAHDAQAARLGWKRYKNLTAVNAPTFTTDRGFAGNGTTSYLNTNFVPSTDGVQYTLNDASLGVYSRTDSASTVRDMGASSIASTNAAMISVKYSDNNRYFNVNSIGAGLTAVANSLGLAVARRTASNAIQTYSNGAEIAVDTDASQSLPTVAMYICARNSNGSPIELSTRQYAAAFVGAAMSEAQQLALYNAIQAYMTAVGAQV